jgi:hypothetical protein
LCGIIYEFQLRQVTSSNSWCTQEKKKKKKKKEEKKRRGVVLGRCGKPC